MELQKAKIQLYSAIGLLPFIAGAIFWVTMIYWKADAAEKTNEKQDQKLESQQVILLEIRDRVIRIEEQTRRK